MGPGCCETPLLTYGWVLIMNLPLSTRKQEDFWAWHCEKSRVFLVPSTYWMLVSNQVRRADWIEHNASRSDVMADQKDWTNLWNVKVPSKVRVFLCKLAKQSIPTRDVRHHRNMAQDGNCSICGRQDSWRHSLLECNMVKCVWVLQGEMLLEFISHSQHDDC